MIVGNGALGEGAAERIDAADIVIRFNDCRSVGRGGSRTDIVAVCNTGRPALSILSGGAWKSSAPVTQASGFWCVRDPAKFSALRSALARSHPELDDFCDDYTAGFAAFAAATGRTMRIVPAAVHEALDDELRVLGAAPYVVPSSGLIVVADVLEGFARKGDEVVLAGFSHEGWRWHPFTAEKAWVENLVAAGWLRRLTNPEPARGRSLEAVS